MAAAKEPHNKLKPVLPIARNFQSKVNPKRRHPPLPVDSRPPWDDNVLIKHRTKRFEKFTQCKVSQEEVPCPDYTCFKACQYNLQGNNAVLDGEVLLLRKNYKIAPWCNPKKYTKEIKHCTEFCCGKTKEFDVEVPNSYRNMYIDEKALRKVELQGQNETRKAFIYVQSDQLQESDKNNDCRRVFYESEQAKLYDERNTWPQRVYKKLDQCALVTKDAE